MLQTSLMSVVVEGCHPSPKVAPGHVAWLDGPGTGLESGDVTCRNVAVLPAAHGDVSSQKHNLHAEVIRRCHSMHEACLQAGRITRCPH
jgi:hypothetical protein